MKMLFFSADRLEIKIVSQAFSEAGIACETRESGLGRALFPDPGEAELWIQNDEDAYKALMLCVELGIGFAKRPPPCVGIVSYPSWDIEDLDRPRDEQDQQQQ